MREGTDLARLQVEQANAEFYRAFEACDLARMEALWATGQHARCVHPGWELLEGWPEIRRSWERIFRNAGHMPITITRLQVRAAGDFGWVSCVEEIVNRARGGEMVTAVLATNVFERDAGGRWRIVQHHASPILAAQPSPRSSPGRDDVN